MNLGSCEYQEMYDFKNIVCVCDFYYYTTVSKHWKYISVWVFFPPQPLQRIENEVELLGEHLPVGGFTYPSSAHPPTLPPSAPLQFLTHDPLHQEVSFGVVSFHSVLLFALITCFELFQCNSTYLEF